MQQQIVGVQQVVDGLVSHGANVLSVISIAIATYLIKVWFQSLRTSTEKLDAKVDDLENRIVALETEVKLTRKGA